MKLKKAEYKEFTAYISARHKIVDIFGWEDKLLRYGSPKFKIFSNYVLRRKKDMQLAVNNKKVKKIRIIIEEVEG